MKPTPETKMHFFKARLDAALARMNVRAGNYRAAAKFADDAKHAWLKVQWEPQP